MLTNYVTNKYRAFLIDISETGQIIFDNVIEDTSEEL